MLELFLNPANMVLGGALISSPIIIHLINRMRYKRVRWAAMEFLLKSQKRNRRRLIIEQLILLALRILLVLLAGLLLARFLGAAGLFKPRNTLHVVVLDDRLSMSDHWKAENAGKTNAFEIGKDLLEKEIARQAVQSRSAQRLVLLRLSHPSEVLFDKRLTDDSLKQLHTVLAGLSQPSQQHLNLAEGVQKAKELFGQKDNAEDEQVLHLISDFRQKQWSEGENNALKTALNALKGVKINLIDTAHPQRGENQKVPAYHDNLAIVELRPETRVAAEGVPIQFSVRVANYSPGERKNVRVTVKVDGEERPEGSLTMQSVPPGSPTEQTFQVGFIRPAGLKPGQPYFALVAVNLENEEVGLQADNLRYAVIEVRRQVPVLLVDGDVSGGEKPGGDTYHLRALFSAARGYEVVRGGVTELERANLDQYPSIYLLNVRELNDKALKNLDTYVRQGGSVAYFLGDRVNAEFYNQKLYAGGKGLFPTPLADRPTQAPTEEEKLQKQLEQIAPNPPLQIFLRPAAATHPVFKEVYKFREIFRYVSIDRHFPVPRQKWKRDDANHIEELATLPNDRPAADYEGDVKSLLDALPVADAAYAKYSKGLERHRREIHEAQTGQALYVLGNALQGLLQDAGEANNPERPSMLEFWDLNDLRVRDLRAQAEQLLERVQMGDPLVVAGRYGRGRTVAVMTTAGTSSHWNDWAGGSPASLVYPVVMVELQKYLTSLEGEADRTVGTPLDLQLESARYATKMNRYFLQEQPEGVTGLATVPEVPGKNVEKLGDQSGVEANGQVAFHFDQAERPGVYLLEVPQRGEENAQPRSDWWAYAVNVDTPNESDLKRASQTELERAAPGVRLFPTPSGAPIVEPQRRTDLSESGWFYLLFLIVLVAEQALAVHLSFHLKGGAVEAVPGRTAEAPAAASAA